MRTPLQFCLFVASLALCLGDFTPGEIPGVYRWKKGAAYCQSDIVLQYSGDEITGSMIRGTNFNCEGGSMKLYLGGSTNGNKLAKFVEGSKAAFGEFITGTVRDRIDCVQRGGGSFTFRKGTIFNFIEPRRDIQINFAEIFRNDRNVGLTVASPFVELDDYSEYLVIDDDCLYRKSWYVCFPASAQVTLENGERKRMDEIHVGDRVSVGKGQFSDVFMWTHKQPTEDLWTFRRIETASGAKLTLTATHHLRASGKLIPAHRVVVGDTVQLADGRESKVVRISDVQERGFYNPQTLHGDIVVDGIVTSTYTNAVAPTKAHAMLAPLRVLYKLIDAVRPFGAADAWKEL